VGNFSQTEKLMEFTLETKSQVFLNFIEKEINVGIFPFSAFPYFPEFSLYFNNIIIIMYM